MYSEGVLFLVFIKEIGHLQAIRFPKVNRAEISDQICFTYFRSF